MRVMPDDAPHGLVVVSGDGVIEHASQRFATWVQRSAQSLAHMHFEELLSPASQILYATHFLPILAATGFANEVMLDVVRADSERFSVLVFGVRKKQAGSDVITLSVFDATEIRRHERELRHAKQQAEAAALALSQANAMLRRQSEEIRITLRSIGDGVITIGKDGLITSINPSAQTLFGVDESEALRTTVQGLGTLLSSASRRPLENIDPLTKEGQFEALLVAHQGHERHVAASVAHLKDDNNAVLDAVLVIRDVTDERVMLQQMAHEASHDRLTGLSNRQEFERRLNTLIHVEGFACHHVLYADVDQLKVVNDVGDHGVGDHILVGIANILKSNARPTDTVARLGGDEFGLILPHCAEDAALHVAEKLQAEISSFNFPCKGKGFSVTASIGLLAFGERKTSAASVMAGADMACNVAKEQGRNRIQAFKDGDVRMRERRGEMTWASKMRRVMEGDRLRLYYQPYAAFRPKAVGRKHGEMLLRIADDNGEVLLPASFIAAAERYNQIEAIDRWVIKSAFAWLSKHPDHEASINLSGQSIGDAQLLVFVVNQFEQSGVSPKRVCFEITETTAISNLASALKFMNSLRGIGVKFALDDFGIGMSSFSYLKALPVDYVKIDGSFTRNLLTDPLNRGIVEAIVRIAEICGFQTIAEWVESIEISEALEDIGVDYAQGWLIGKPMPI